MKKLLALLAFASLTLVACTEKRTKAEIDAFAEALKSAIEEVK